jgi:hypothetical protein
MLATRQNKATMTEIIIPEKRITRIVESYPAGVTPAKLSIQLQRLINQVRSCHLHTQFGRLHGTILA